MTERQRLAARKQKADTLLARARSNVREAARLWNIPEEAIMQIGQGIYEVESAVETLWRNAREQAD